MSEAVEIAGSDFRKMQLLQMDMLKEFDRVCRENQVKYTIFGGTLLGAVRHGGYIPWDDDADIAMLRSDYEKFKGVADQLDPSICFFQDHSNDSGYRWGYGKLRRVGTEYVRIGQEHLTCKTGVFVDVFPMDDAPASTVGQVAQDFFCMCLRKVLWSEVGRLDASSGAIKRAWFTVLSKISPNVVFSLLKRMTNNSNRTPSKRVRTLLFPATGTLYRKNSLSTRFSMPREWFTDLAEYDFEGTSLFGTRDYDAALSYIYGDYMALPPVEDRKQHAPVSSYRF